jgi:hypothetical protein
MDRTGGNAARHLRRNTAGWNVQRKAVHAHANPAGWSGRRIGAGGWKLLSDTVSGGTGDARGAKQDNQIQRTPLAYMAADQGIDKHTSMRVNRNHPAPCQIGQVPPLRHTR